MTKLGYQLSSLKPYLTTREGLLTACQKLYDIGYRDLQLQWIDPTVAPADVREVLAISGMNSIATQEYFENIWAHIEDFISFNQLTGSPSITVSRIPQDMMTLEGLEKFAGMMATLTERFEAAGISLDFHPIAENFEAVAGVSAVFRVMDLMPESAGLTFCVMQAVRAGLDPVDMIHRYQGRIEICHFKDYLETEDGQVVLTPLGQGSIDWPPILEACRETGVQWVLAEQESWQKDAFVCAAESYTYLSELGLRAE